MLECMVNVVGMIPEAINDRKRAEAGRDMGEGCVKPVNSFSFKVTSSGRNGGRAATHKHTHKVVILHDHLHWCGYGGRKRRGISCKQDARMSQKLPCHPSPPAARQGIWSSTNRQLQGTSRNIIGLGFALARII